MSSDTKSVFDTGRGSFEALRDDFLVLQFLVQLVVFLPFEVLSKEVTFGIWEGGFLISCGNFAPVDEAIAVEFSDGL